MEITIEVHHEGPSFWAAVPELGGCFASGRTLSELAEAVHESVSMCLERLVRLDHEPLQVGCQLARAVV